MDMVLIASCSVFFWVNNKLHVQVETYKAMLTPAKGTLLPPLTGEDWKGVAQSIAYENDPRPTLVYTFSKECGYCQENWHAMRAFQALSPSSLRIVYIDTVGDAFTPKYLSDTGIAESALLVRLSSAAVATMYQARAVPQVVIVDRNGRVRWSHLGGLDGREVSSALSVITRQ